MPSTKKETRKKTKTKVSKVKKVKDPKKSSSEVLEKKIKDVEDKHLRLKAEFENFRRRKAEEISKILLFDGEKVIIGFLPIIDDLRRMVNTKDSNENLLKDGVKLVDAKIEKYFESIEVLSFGETGDIMDPELHDAMLTQKDKKAKNNSILEVFEKGYTYREKVIRHAKVIVNKK